MATSRAPASSCPAARSANQPARPTFADIDAGGRINALDISAIKQRLNQTLPAVQPASRVLLSARDLFGNADKRR